jgi:uncharacterized Zn finger protein (UPF0148 family)
MTPETCPNCGADVPRHARACPGCGADERTGWSEDAEEQATRARLGLPSEEFDHDEFVQEEFAETPRVKRRGLHWLWWLVALALVAWMLWAVLGPVLKATMKSR